MTITPARDIPEFESLEPASALSQWRKERDEDRYRAWCENTYGLVELGTETFHPADIFDALGGDAARRGRDEVAASVREDLEQAVCEQFPSPIAVPFHGFLEGPREPLRRLYRLRDCWEGLIRLLSALVLADCVSFVPSISGLTVRENERDNPRLCKRKDLLADRLATRIGIIGGGIDTCREIGIRSKILSIVPDGIVAELRRLNSVRNGFSHEGVKSDTQVEKIIEEAYPLLREVLLDLSRLEEVRLFRFKRLIPGAPPLVEAEHFFGHAQSQRIRETKISASSAAVVMTAASIGNLDRIFALIDDDVLDLSPFYYALDDETGHRTRIAFFKFRKDDRWSMEIVGDSNTLQYDAEPHDILMGRFDSLLAMRNDAP